MNEAVEEELKNNGYLDYLNDKLEAECTPRFSE